jgi:hypothetical protein
VRAAWRRIAAATHPDRDDGGDPARFGAAAAAYALLRTAYGRGEALADLGDRTPRSYLGTLRRYSPETTHLNDSADAGRAAKRRRGGLRRVRGRVLALRVVAATAVCAGAFTVVGWAPASIGVLTGALTWLVATGRHDIAPAARE